MLCPVLLVEDNSDDVLWARRVFRWARIDNPVEVASSGEEAIRYLTGTGESVNRDTIPVLVLLDLMLPGKCGLDVLRWIKAQTRLASLPVIVLSSSDNLNLLSRARELGALSFLLKPLQPNQLIARLTGRKGFQIKTTGVPARKIIRAGTVCSPLPKPEEDPAYV